MHAPEAPEETPAPPADPVGGLRRKVLSSATWTLAGFGTMQILRFVINIVMTWLVAPDVFGLMALVDVFIIGLHLFSDIGIGSALVRSPRGDDPAFYNTAWTLASMRGCVLWLASCLIAYPVAVIYEVPLLVWLMPAAALTSLINGFNSTALFSLERHLSQGKLTLIQLAQYVVSQAVVIGCVYRHVFENPVWALVVGRLIGSTLEVAASFVVLPGYRNRFQWDKGALHDLLHFGKWIFVSTLFTFLADQADKLVVGKVISLKMLGVYNVAVQLCLVPRSLMNALVPKLVLPVYSRLHHAGQPLRDLFLRVHPVATGFAAYMVAGLIGTGSAVIHAVYREVFWDAAWMLELLAVGAWLAMLEGPASALLWAQGITRVSAFSNAAKALSLPLLAALGYQLGGLWGGEEAALPGMIVGFAASDLARYVWTAREVSRQGLPVFGFDVTLSLAIGVSVLCTWGLQWALNQAGIPPRPLALALVLFVTALWGGAAAVVWKRGGFQGLRG